MTCYANYWGMVLDDYVDDAGDFELFDPGAEVLEQDEDGDPEDLLDELGIL